MAEITIEHSGDGTLVYGTSKADAAVLSGAGFRWSGRLQAWYLPRTWRMPTRDVRVRELVGLLGDRAAVAEGAAAKASTAAEREQARVDALVRSADRHGRRADRAEAEAEAHGAKADRISSGIPMGQPILIGHHSERRHRRDLDRIHTSTRRSIEADRTATQERRLAEGAQAQLERGESPVTRLRRLERNEAELRRLDRILHGTGKAVYGHAAPIPPGPHRDRIEARRVELAQDIEHDRAKGDPAFGPHNVQPGDIVTVRGHRLQVTQTGTKTFGYVGTPGMHNRAPYLEITAQHRPAGPEDGEPGD